MGISNTIAAISSAGGVAYSNNFDVKFRFSGPSNKVQSALNSVGIDVTKQTGSSASPGKWINLFCEEAVLPGVQSSTGTITGRHMGEGQVNYPTSRIFTDFSLTWICDANMTPLKFLHVWSGQIYREYGSNGKEFDYKDRYYNNKKDDTPGNNRSGGSAYGSNRYNYVRLNYPEDYLCDEVIITKCEKGPFADNQRQSISIHCVDVFPYSIDAIPLSYGSSQIVRVTANFYYSKWFSTFNTLWGRTN
jgi:hypothetical protein